MFRQTRKARIPQRSLMHRILREWVGPFVIAAAVIVPIRSAIADWNDVPTGSMKPTIIEGDRIFVNKLAFGLRVPLTRWWITHWSEPRRGDIVTCASPDSGTRLVKRIIGVPGDRVSMYDNQLIINGEPVEVALTSDLIAGELPDGRPTQVLLAREDLGQVEHSLILTPAVPSARSFPEIVVPRDQYFVLGDNRDVSSDSRVFGFVPFRNIYGRSSHVLFSLDYQNWYMPRPSRFLAPIK